MSATALLVELTAKGIELRTEGPRLRFRPVAKMTPELLELVKRHKAELLSLVCRGVENCAGTYSVGELQRFLQVAVPWPDGRGWYDLQSLQDEAGQAYVEHIEHPPPGESEDEVDCA